MLSDLKYIILWWFTMSSLGLLSLPFIFPLFRRFWDRGYAFAKIASVIIITYVALVLGIFHFLPFTSVSLFILILLLALFGYLYLKNPKRYTEFINTFSTKWKIFLLEELIFLIVLIAWSYVRGFAPDIEGLEKYMDWGFVNSALRGRFLPPADMWFSGSSINYYYFGHLMIAVLTRLSNIDSAITYNLAIASTCALTFISTFSLSGNFVHLVQKKYYLKHIIVAGFISALLLTFGGNLHTVYKIIKLDIEQNQGKFVLTRTALTSAANSYWYPDATRFIGYDPDVQDKTIHEFPVYSFVVADLHGHMNDIPVILFYVAFLLASSYAVIQNRINFWLIVPAGFLLSIAYMTNAWDFAVYGLVYAVSYFLISLNGSNLKNALRFVFNHGILIILFWYLFTLPFSLDFTPMAEGLRFSDSRSPFYQLFILYGGFWLICLPFIIFLFKSKFRRLQTPDLFVLALIIVATILIIIPEIGYIKDIYIYEHRRANTMFKLVYQAFIIYSLVSGYIFIKLKSNLFYKIIFGFILVCHLIYPYFAVRSYYGLTDYKGLWGLNYLKTLSPDNYQAIDWIKHNITGQPVMLEAAGDSYTTFNHVSSATGLPTIEGWLVHEWLWRGGYDQPGARAEDVGKIYQSTDADEVRSLLQKYSVQYIFVGDNEYQKYPDLNLKNFDDLGAKVIFTSGNTKIYQLY